MLGRFVAFAMLVCALAVTPGCLYRGAAARTDPQSYHGRDGWVVLREVPFVEQSTTQGCGGAVVASVRRYWGELGVDETSVRREAGSTANEPMRAGALRKVLHDSGYHAFIVKADLALLASELAKGRPVIIATVKPYLRDTVLSHYQVVLGVHPSRGLLTMDPSDGYRHYPQDGLLAEWEPAQRLAIVVAPRAPD